MLAATPVSRRLNKLVDPISTLTAEPAPAPIAPGQHRTEAVASLALAPRDITRHG